MTIEISTDDLQQITEAADRYGACVFKTQTTDGEEIWIAAQNHHKPGRKRAGRIPGTGSSARPAVVSTSEKSTEANGPA